MEKTNLFVVTASPNYFNQAFNELRDVDRDLKIVENLFNGIFIVQPSMEKEDFEKALVAYNPVFVRHVHSVEYLIPGEDLNNPGIWEKVLFHYKKELESCSGIAIQIRKGKSQFEADASRIRDELFGLLESQCGVKQEVKQPSLIFSLFIHNDRCYLGLGNPTANLSAWSGGMIHYKKEDSDISRAKFKLMEAIYVFKIDMSNIKTALDLGAAPGGWTSVLLEHGVNVTAVDTGDMDARLMKNRKLTFIKQNVGEMDLGDNRFDMLTSDISWNPIHTANLISNAAIYLEEGGTAIVTVKLMAAKISKTIKEVREIYKNHFEILGARQLFHNRDEITLYMKKK